MGHYARRSGLVFPNYKNYDNKSTILLKGNESYLKSLKELIIKA